jgi:hypothetical protein
MSSSDPHRRGGATVAEATEVSDLTPSRISLDKSRCVNLHDLGFVGYVTAPAMAEIASNECRASRVVTTAATFAFR